MALTGKEWEQHINTLLRLRHKPENYVQVPDQDRGDLGLEGFSRDERACAYQCYAPQGPLSTADLRKKLRVKLTTDTKKFIDNAKKLKALLGTTVIKRWVLVVPEIRSKELVNHANKRAVEILKAKLDHVDSSDFHVGFQTLVDFTLEQALLQRTGLAKLRLPAPVVSEEEVSEWVGDNDELVCVLEEKLKCLGTLEDPGERRQYRDDLIHKYVLGQNKLEKLKDHPEFWETVLRIKSERQSFLALETRSSSSAPPELLQEQVTKLKAQWADECPALTTADLGTLAWGTVGDWLLRCPLSFPKRGGSQ